MSNESMMTLKKEKVCFNCQEPKPVSAYRPDKYQKDGLTRWCDVCRGETKETTTKAVKPSRKSEPND